MVAISDEDKDVKRIEDIKSYLSGIEINDCRNDLISSCMVRNIRVVGNYIYLKLFLGSDQLYLENKVKDALKVFEWAEKIYVDVKQISGVKRTIAIGSGKGGVGKSSVTLGLALNLINKGFKVGVLDADVYGPNIPILLGLNEVDVLTNDQDGITKFVPINYKGLQIMSVGMLAKREQGLAWRGPILTRLLNQFLYQVQWEDLDFLLIDLPPGTGDTQITILQDSPTIGMLLVTTSGIASLSDLSRTISMYKTFGMPILGVVENLSSFKCPCCNSEYQLFADNYSLNKYFGESIPIISKIPMLYQENRIDNKNPFISSKYSFYFNEMSNKLINSLIIK